MFWEREQLIQGVKAAASARGIGLSVYSQNRIRLPGRQIKVAKEAKGESKLGQGAVLGKPTTASRGVDAQGHEKVVTSGTIGMVTV